MKNMSDRRDLRGLAKALEPISRQAERAGLQWILLGAQARDLVLEIEGLKPIGRRSLSLDLGVRVMDWDEYEQLRQALIRKESAEPIGRAPHRLRLPRGTRVDLIPFGGVEERGHIVWPPKSTSVLDVRGLGDAMQFSNRVVLPGGLIIQVPNLPAYMCLKLFAWKSQRTGGQQSDAEDLRVILRSVCDLISVDDLNQQYHETLLENEHDTHGACTQILGERMRDQLEPETTDILIKILEDELHPGGEKRLAQQWGDNQQVIPLVRAIYRGLHPR